MNDVNRHGDSIARNTFFALAAQGATALFTAALTIFLVRELEPEGYGLFALAISAGSLALLPADFGIAQSTARYIAERRGDARAVVAALAKGLRLKFVLTSAFTAAVVALAEPIAQLYGEPGLAGPLRGVFIALLGQSVMLLFMKAFVAVGRVSVQFRLVAFESAVEFSASVALVLVAGGATGAAFGRAIGYGFGALAGIALAWSLFRHSPFRLQPGGPRFRELATYASALLVIDGAFALFSQLDVLLIGAVLGAASAGIYAAPLKLTTLLHYPGLAAASAVAPRLAKHPEHPPDLPALTVALRYLIILQAGIAAGIAVWATPIVDLVLGPAYEESAEVLLALSPLVFLKGLGPLVSATINYVGEARRRIPIAVGSVIINLALLAVLLPELGVVGAAISVDIAYALYTGGHLWLCRRTLGLRLRPLGGIVTRSTIAAAGLAGALAVFGTTKLAAWEWPAGAVSGAAAFVILLLATGEVKPREIRQAVAATRARFGRG